MPRPSEEWTIKLRFGQNVLASIMIDDMVIGAGIGTDEGEAIKNAASQLVKPEDKSPYEVFYLMVTDAAGIDEATPIEEAANTIIERLGE